MQNTTTNNATQATQAQNNEPALKPFPTSYPGGITPDTLFDERTEKIIAAQADKLIQTGLFQQHERDDLANEFRIILAYEMATYNPSRDRYTFVATILAKRGVNMIIHRRVENGRLEQPLSLNEIANEGVTFLDLLSEDDYRDAWGNRPVSEAELNKRDQGLKAMLASLSQTDVDICNELMKGTRMEDIGALVGLTKGAVCKRVSRVIRPVAIACGFVPANLSQGGDEA